MTSGYRSWDKRARTLALAVEAAVDAVDAADADRFDDALADLHKADREQLLVLLGTATSDLLERAAPDGLDAEEAERILRGSLRDAAPWYPAIDSNALLRAFTASLGIADPDDEDSDNDGDGDRDDDAVRVTPDAVLAHGVLLVGYLRRTTAAALPEVLEHALGELRRAQTMEMP